MAEQDHIGGDIEGHVWVIWQKCTKFNYFFGMNDLLVDPPEALTVGRHQELWP